MMYTRYWQYGMRILLGLAALEPDTRISAAEIARRTGVPAAFASKILGRLTQARLVTSRRGPGGGVALARAASAIRVRDLVHAVGEEGALAGCILGFSECSDTTPCPVHDIWKEMRANLKNVLLDRSIEDFARLQKGPPGGKRRRAERRPRV
jgi:Rrf2 family protein